MKKIIFSVLCFLATQSFAQEKISIPHPVASTEETTTAAAPELPEDLKGLVWNKWDTENFIVISIDKNQGLYLKNNLDKIKTNLLNSWGFKDFKFSGECKIVCVSDKKLLKRIFRLDSPRFEIKKNENGKTSCAIWFSQDQNIPESELMQLCLFQIENYYKHDFLLFCKKGISVLSDSNVANKKKLLLNKLDNISFEDLLKQNEEESNFDAKSAIVCLLMCKEYGKSNFLAYLKTKNLNEFGINDVSKFNEIINRYYKNLFDDLQNNRTPEDYLTIK